MTDPEPESIPLREIAYRRLRQDILSCRLLPGQRITERQIVADTGLGISAIREALTRLDHEGLVRTQPRRGYQVKPMTIKAIDDLFNFWELVGPEVVRRGVAEVTPDQLDRAIALFEQTFELGSAAAPSREPIQRWLQLSKDSFAVFVDAVANDYFNSSLRLVAGELQRVWSLLDDLQLMVSVARENSAGWNEALSRRDGDLAAGLTRRFIRQSHDHILRALARWPSVISSEIVPMPLPANTPQRRTAPPANTSTELR